MCCYIAKGIFNNRASWSRALTVKKAFSLLKTRLGGKPNKAVTDLYEINNDPNPELDEFGHPIIKPESTWNLIS